MGTKTTISWTDCTWSPLRAKVKDDAAAIAAASGYTSMVQIATRMAGRIGPHCERVSHGCDICYSDTNNRRCLPSNGTGLPFDRRSRDLVEPFVDEKILLQPLKWKKPQRIFVENQSDLFGEWNTDEMIDRVFAVMTLCQQHSFQVLTKRPDRMLEYFGYSHVSTPTRVFRAGSVFRVASTMMPAGWFQHPVWPLQNVWLGVSVEDQNTADYRIPCLLKTHAAVRFISYEPALAGIYLAEFLAGIDWVIVGGESGAGARPFDIAWARNVIEQCREADVPCFVKQLGANPSPWFDLTTARQVRLKDRKGGDMSEWPEDLRVRQFPEVQKVA